MSPQVLDFVIVPSFLMAVVSTCPTPYEGMWRSCESKMNRNIIKCFDIIKH